MTCTATPLAGGPHAGLKYAITAAGSPRALPLWCGPERIIISVTRPTYITSKSIRFRWPYKTLKICERYIKYF